MAIGLLTGSGTGFSGVDEASTPGILKGYGILLSLIGAALVGVVYALITDAIIGARLLATLGRRQVPASIRDHVIVCGLGSIGFRVALGIRERGVKVVVVEPDEENGRFVAARSGCGTEHHVQRGQHRADGGDHADRYIDQHVTHHLHPDVLRTGDGPDRERNHRHQRC